MRLMGSPTTGQSGPARSRQVGNNVVMTTQYPSVSREPRRYEMIESPVSPDTKRRRIANGTYGPLRIEKGSLTPYSVNHRSDSLPRPEFMPKGHFAINAPPKPQRFGLTPHESSLTLPPLQTSAASDAAALANSVEAMVMSIPQINKVKVLGKISAPLNLPGPGSPLQATRGAIIAVDGVDRAAVDVVKNYLADFLARDHEHTVRIFEGSSVKPEALDTTFATCLQMITEWHGISDDVIKYITTLPPPIASPPLSPKSVPGTRMLSNFSTQESSKPEREAEMEASIVTTRPETPDRTSNSGPITGSPVIESKKSPTTACSFDFATKARPTPIAIIPQYQLSLTDAAASRCPIKDAYAPIDHWQWMATLWRGVVGPDITVVIKGVDNSGNNSPKEDGVKGAVVEIRLADARAVAVRMDQEGKISIGSLRRVGFEIGEWLRAFNEVEGRRNI